MARTLLTSAVVACISLCFAPLADAHADSPTKKPAVGSGDWTSWRGGHHDGIAASEQSPPTTWSKTQNVAWKAKVPGRGHGSPAVLGDQVFLQTADSDRDTQTVISFDRQTGQQNWETVCHTGGQSSGNRKPNEKATYASSTIATDGERLFANFYNAGKVHTTALSLTGEILWQREITDYEIHQGFGTSPAVYQDLVIVSADNKSGGAIVGLERATGKVRWRRDRPAKPNYASPIILTASGREQLVFLGCDLVTSLNPATGELLWEHEGSTTECVASTVTDGTHVFTSGGYPKNHIAAMVADGSGNITWETNTRVYVPSMVCKDGYLFAVLDAGIAACIDCKTGDEVWKQRLGGTFTSSLVLVGDQIFATNEEGTTFIFKANPERFEQVGENKLGESVFATPAICGGQIFARVAHAEDGRRQEYLYRLGQ
ncbi:outer membrane protein assembly factor BamB family protein [Stieleria varia]|uniref:Outer membrane biogenesis protein BamB n=1 Tax=Stieleria varia TaxID=2528005 RepID=A0A5C6A6H6_9BACT|nr:PQQ-binding-like beta-propeller repeat protein [Stieleria varia]TWT93943.1 outer membrane biogenesis protein BamB [Stieleria varia]